MKISILDNLITNPKLKILRHVLLLAGLSLISINQAYLIFNIDLGINIFPIFTIFLGGYIFLAYYNIYSLVPKYLMQNKYWEYGLRLSLLILIFQIILILMEYLFSVLLYIPSPRSTYFNMVSVLDILSNYFLNLVCISGITITVLWKNFTLESDKVKSLERKALYNEVEQLKSQASPDLLFKVLNKTAALAQNEPDMATEMLYNLSQILRYQLYDSAREKVFLMAEIGFLRNYLTLESQHDTNLEYNISNESSVINVLLPPLLFIPIIQEFIKAKNDSTHKPVINIEFNTVNDKLQFKCESNFPVHPNAEMVLKIRQRFDLLFEKEYTLDIQEKKDHCLLTLVINNVTYEE